MGERLTEAQRRALRYAKYNHDRQWRLPAGVVRVLEPAGLIKARPVEMGFYAFVFTPAGRKALEAGDG